MEKKKNFWIHRKVKKKKLLKKFQMHIIHISQYYSFQTRISNTDKIINAET